MTQVIVDGDDGYCFKVGNYFLKTGTVHYGNFKELTEYRRNNYRITINKILVALV